MAMDTFHSCGPPQGLTSDEVTHTFNTVLTTPLTPTAAERKKHLGNGEKMTTLSFGDGAHKTSLSVKRGPD